MPDPDNTGAAERARKKAIMKRDESIRRIRSVHDLAVQCENDLSLVDQLSLLTNKIDEIWSKFTIDGVALIDSLIYLYQESEYPIDQVAELCDSISVCRETVKRYTSSRSINVSFRRDSLVPVSEHGFVSKLKLNEDSGGKLDIIRTQALSSSASVIEAQTGSGPSDNSIPRRSTYVKPARLPEIPLPIFHSEIFKWLMFRNHFTYQVHRDPSIPDIDKLFYIYSGLFQRENFRNNHRYTGMQRKLLTCLVNINGAF